MAEVQLDPTGSVASNPTVPATGNRTDPLRDGLVGIYALRILDRGVDPRTLVAEHRATRYGLSGRPPRPLMVAEQTGTIAEVGRGAVARPGQASSEPVPASPSQAPLATRTRVRRLALPSAAGLASLLFGQQPAPARTSRRLVTAGVAIATLLGVGAAGALTEEQPVDHRSVVSINQP